MNAIILAVGSEMLTPFKTDTNSLAVTERLNALGYDVRTKLVVGDRLDDIVSALRSVIGRVELVVCTGGLGPTEDDLTRDALAQVLDVDLEVDPAILDELRARFARRGIVMRDNNARQAQVPRGVAVVKNANGTAPGLLTVRAGTIVALLPGPPREMTPMLEGLIRDGHIPARSGGLFRRVLRITGRPESEVDAIAHPVYSPWRTQPIPITTTILAVLGQIELHLTAAAPTREAADAALTPAVEALCASLGSSVFSVDGRPLEAVVGDQLRQAGWMASVAESCTGGLLASRLTDVPGSSEYFDRGVVCYSNQAKVDLLGVPLALIEEQGAVSEPVALAMASGIRTRAGTVVGIGITGIAGPGGGTDHKPVGTVAVAVVAGSRQSVRTLHLFGSREQIKYQAAQAAMNMLRLMMIDART
ncbi:MAG: competence/damage-inducible protein A [Acidimicrobiia bacterium]|nr:competence/damage-inducible protein A [Acidimicrobiia bacterium]